MLTKRMSNNWQGVVSLVLSKAEGRIASSARTGPSAAQTSAAGTFGQAAAGPNDWVNTDGLLHRRQAGRCQGAARLPLPVGHHGGRSTCSTRRGVSGRGRFARPAWAFRARPSINMEANTGDRRVEDVDLIDLRVQKEFGWGGSSTRLGLFFDALNLTNANHNENVAQPARNRAVTAFGVPTRLYLPRRVQLGTKLRW